MINPDFNMNKRILIVGGFGFLGRNLYLHLKKSGYRTINIFSNVQLSHDDPLRKEFTHKLYTGSINNKQLIDEVIASHDVVFSFAGLSGAATSINTPFEDIHINLEGQLNILESCRKKSAATKVIFPSTRLVYGMPMSIPVSENHPVSPQSIYAIHKNTVEHYHLLYSKLHEVSTVIFRISNPYGFNYNPIGMQYSILNQFVLKAILGETIKIYGEGKQARDYIYIDDLSRLLELAIHNDNLNGQIFNIGSGKGISIVDTVRTIKKYVPQMKFELTDWPELEQNIETGDYVSDLTKIHKMSDWLPGTDIETGIRLTIKAYQKLIDAN